MTPPQSSDRSRENPFSLEGRRALVTGGNQGLGLGFVHALAAAGADVAFISRDAKRNAEALAALRSAGLDGHSHEADITDSAQLADGIRWAIDALDGIDILVNNAGACVHADSFEVTDQEWDSVLDLNVTALFRCSVAVARHMAESGGGSIVNIGSMSGLIVNRPQHQAGYNASKAAVHQLTRSLAAEWADFGIRVNAVAPGYVRTEMTPADRPEFRRYWIDDAPLKRVASVEEIAPSVVFLASDAASFITGSVLVADGGYSVY